MFSNPIAAPMMEAVVAAIRLWPHPDTFFAAWGFSVLATLFVCVAGIIATCCGYSRSFCERLARTAIKTSVVALSFTAVQIYDDTKEHSELVSQKPTSRVKHPGPKVIIPVPKPKPQQSTPAAQTRSHEAVDELPQPVVPADEAETDVSDDTTFETDQDDIDWAEDDLG